MANFEWGAGEMEDSFESLGEQEANGGNGEASYYEQERNGPVPPARIRPSASP